jgi:Na+/proline symporter
LQISLVILGLIVLAVHALLGLGDGSLIGGFGRLIHDTPPEMLRPFPTESAAELLDWLAVFAIGALGNIPGQDLMQRVFASRSAKVARRACVLAGIAYLTIGLIPLGLGLVARLSFGDSVERSILPALAHQFMHPASAVIFTIALMSAVLSTIDSAILSPASVLAQNLFEKVNRGRLPSLALNQAAVVLVTAASLGMAYLGEDAYALLEGAYELTLVGLFVPLALGLCLKPRGELPALASMLTGSVLWLVHYGSGWKSFLEPWLLDAGWQLPPSLMTTGSALLVYLFLDRALAFKERRP